MAQFSFFPMLIWSLDTAMRRRAGDIEVDVDDEGVVGKFHIPQDEVSKEKRTVSLPK